MPAYLGGPGLDGGDAGGVHQGLGPASRLLDQALPLAGQPRELLLVLVEARVHAVLEVGWRRDLDPFLLLPKHGAKAAISTPRAQTWAPASRPVGGGRSPDPAHFSQLLRPCPGPGSCHSSSPPWSPVPHRQPERPRERPSPLRALSQVLPVPHCPTTCPCPLSALVSPSFTLVVKPQGPCTGCSLLVAHSSPVSTCGSLLPLSGVSDLLVNLFLTTPSEGGAPLAFCHKASQHVQLLEILLFILVFTTRMLGVYTPPYPKTISITGQVSSAQCACVLPPAQRLAPSLCSGTEQLFDDCFHCPCPMHGPGEPHCNTPTL